MSTGHGEELDTEAGIQAYHTRWTSNEQNVRGRFVFVPYLWESREEMLRPQRQDQRRP